MENLTKSSGGIIKWFLIIVAALIFVVVLSTTPLFRKAGSNKEKQVATSKDEVVLRGIKYKLVEAKELTATESKGLGKNIDGGGKYIMVTFEAKNLKAKDMGSWADINLVDGRGEKYTFSITPLWLIPKENACAGKLPANSTRRCSKIFEVKKDATGLKLESLYDYSGENLIDLGLQLSKKTENSKNTKVTPKITPKVIPNDMLYNAKDISACLKNVTCFLKRLDTFKERLSSCVPSEGIVTVGMESALGILRHYKIKGPDNNLCVVDFSFVKNPDSDFPKMIEEKGLKLFKGLEMTCEYNPSERTIKKVADTDNNCSGPLFKEIKKFKEALKQGN